MTERPLDEATFRALVEEGRRLRRRFDADSALLVGGERLGPEVRRMLDRMRALPERER